MNVSVYAITDQRSFIAVAKSHRKAGYMVMPYNRYVDILFKLKDTSHLRSWLSKNTRPYTEEIEQDKIRIDIWPAHMDLIIDL